MRHFQRRVIDGDHIEVGTERQVSAPPFAIGQNGEAAVREGPVPFPELLQRRRQQRLDGCIGDFRQVGSRFPGGASPLKEAQPDLEPRIVRPTADDVEHVLVGLRYPERAAKVCAHPAVQRRATRQYAFEHARMMGHVLGEERGVAEHFRDKIDELRIGLEHREDGNAERQTGQETVEIHQHAVRFARAGKRLDQARDQFRQDFPRPCASGRPYRAGMPGTDDFEDPLRIAKAQPGKRRCRARVGVRAGEHQIARFGQRVRLGEQAVVKLPNIAEMAQQVLRKGVLPAVTHEAREAGKAARIRQFMGLPVVDHLDAVLDAAQEPVGVLQAVGRAALDMARRDKRFQRLAGRADAQTHIAAAPDQLLRLHIELDLADAAASELYIVPGDREPVMAAIGVDLPLDGMDVLYRPEVEAAPPDERADIVQEGLPGGEIAGHRAGLQHGGPFPILAHALVIGLGGPDGHGQRRRGRIGAKPQIDPLHIAVRSALLQQADQVSREPDHRLAGPVPPPHGQGCFVVDQHDVDVARIVEFAGAELAHAENHDARILRPGAGVFASSGEQVANGRIQGGSRERAQRSGDLFQRPFAGDVGDGDRGRKPGAFLPEGPHPAGGVAIGQKLPEPRKQRLERPVRPLGGKVPGKIGKPQQAIGKERAGPQRRPDCAASRAVAVQRPDLRLPVLQTAGGQIGVGRKRAALGCRHCSHWSHIVRDGQAERIIAGKASACPVDIGGPRGLRFRAGGCRRLAAIPGAGEPCLAGAARRGGAFPSRGRLQGGNGGGRGRMGGLEPAAALQGLGCAARDPRRQAAGGDEGTGIRPERRRRPQRPGRAEGSRTARRQRHGAPADRRHDWPRRRGERGNGRRTAGNRSGRIARRRRGRRWRRLCGLRRARGGPQGRR